MALESDRDVAAPPAGTGRFRRTATDAPPAPTAPPVGVTPPAPPAPPAPPVGVTPPAPPEAVTPPTRSVPPEAATPPPPADVRSDDHVAPRSPSPWPDRLKRWSLAIAGLVYRALCRPRVRLTVIGATLLLIGALVVRSSVWTLPLVVVGVGMLLIAWIGSRLDGRFAVEWGETGTQLEFRAQIKAPVQPSHPAALAAPPAPKPVVADSEPEDAEVIEGEAHTIEIDVEELKALIAAAEAEEQSAPQAA